jgi:3-oxoadipate enol-lactonase
LGVGTAILHIHGSAFGHRNFERLTPLLTDRFEVIDFDLPGYGQSKGGPAPKGMDDIADLVAELIGALGFEKIDIHGTSFGAMIALLVAARHPERVDRLVLSCFLARYDKAAQFMRATWRRAAAESGMEAVADLTSVAGFARRFYNLPWADEQLASMRDAFSHTDPQAFIASTLVIGGTDLSPLVGELKAPALLIAGAEDNMTPFRPAEGGVGMAEIAEQLPGAKTVVIPECGHYLVIEAADQAAELVSDFLRR